MKVASIFLFLSLINLDAFSCEPGEIAFSQTTVCAKVEWQSKPVFNQYTSASVTLKNNSNYTLNVIPWMVMGGGHEHGSRPVVITTVSPDDYLVEKIYFMGGMMGDWFLRLQLLNSKKQIIEESRVKVDLK